MIARLWHGAVPKDKADRYYRFLIERAVPDYQSVAGNRGIYIMRRVVKDVSHFNILTLWDSESSIAEFAGQEIDRAQYYPEDPEFLIEMEPKVTHFDVAFFSGSYCALQSSRIVNTRSS